MTKLLQRVELTLRSFYIFNSNFGQNEGEEHKKILYYHPNDIELNTKIKDVGLSEAIIIFTGTFTLDKDCKALHTQKTTQLFYQPEPGYWMVLVLNVPKEIKLKDGVEITEYRGGDVGDRIYSTMLRHCYYMYRLFYGTFQVNGESAREQLCEGLQEFFNKHLHTLKLPNCDVIDMMHTMQYLALDKALFLRAHNFINMVRATFGSIAEAILLHNEHIVCSGQLPPLELNCLHEYIVGNILEKTTQTELVNVGVTRSNSANAEQYQNGAFITGPEANADAPNEMSVMSTKPPKVYITVDGVMHAYYMIIYRALSSTLCLFFKADKLTPAEFYAELHAYIGPQLINLSRDISAENKNVAQTNSVGGAVEDADDGSKISPKYLFINEQSLKHHTNIIGHRCRRQHLSANSIPKHVVSLIADYANDLDVMSLVSTTNNMEELQVKTTSDYWIMKRSCNGRQYYVILYSKSTLLDVAEEAKRIFEQELKDDVFFDK